MNIFKKVALGLGFAAAFGTAGATPVAGASLQNVINGLYTAAGTPIGAAPNVNTNQYGLDQVWQVEASGQTAATFIIELAGNAGSNTMGVYSLTNPSVKVELFSGAATGGYKANLAINVNGGGSVTYFDNNSNFLGATGIANGTFLGGAFGYYMGYGSSPQSYFYSQTSLNGGSDQMVAYQGDGDLIKLPSQNAGVWGASSFVLAWEDILYANSDKDFDDMVVYVESVKGVPEPATLALVGLSLAGLGFMSRRRRS